MARAVVDADNLRNTLLNQRLHSRPHGQRALRSPSHHLGHLGKGVRHNLPAAEVHILRVHYHHNRVHLRAGIQDREGAFEYGDTQYRNILLGSAGTQTGAAAPGGDYYAMRYSRTCHVILQEASLVKTILPDGFCKTDVTSTSTDCGMTRSPSSKSVGTMSAILPSIMVDVSTTFGLAPVPLLLGWFLSPRVLTTSSWRR